MSEKSKAKALTRLNRVLEQVPQIMALSTGSSEFERWRENATAAIRHAFGEESEQLSKFKKIMFIPIVWGNGTDWQEPFQRGMQKAQAQLRSLVDEIEEYWPDEELDVVGRPVPNVSSGSGSKVFVIHGHDEAAKLAIAGFLRELGLEPVILAEQPSGGKTIIEKFETHADVGYAVALLTADDFGSRQGDDAVRPRARQNVIFELGYFIGRLGRKRVCALTKGQPEIPSDYSGVVYIPMASDAWKMELIKELKAAGFDVDANKVFG